MDDQTREREHRYRLLIENFRDYAIFMIDPAGMVSSWNDGAQEILGYAENEILGQSAERFFLTEDRHSCVPQTQMETAARFGRAADERWHIRKDGSRFFASGVLSAIRNEAG